MSIIKWSRIGRIDRVKRLLDRGVDPNTQVEYGSSPLIIASRTNNIGMVDLLLRYGADPDIQGEEGWTPLMYAAAYDHMDVARLLLSANADIGMENIHGHTAYDLGGWEMRNIIHTRGQSLYQERDRSREYIMKYDDVDLFFSDWI